ncbi:MAG TPA: DUF2336 domain-containing protein [Xanthobacteraceae bacterium]|jgi:uncharacterized protein (DUF2336 family)|nr:DUF2336 domain-containing protein [Xanthobacteraceae bacterium]
MAARNSLIVELEDALQRGSTDRRAETLRRITDLFLGSADRFTSAQVALFDDVIGCLIDRIETRALVELGQRLAPVANAPERVIRRLARNDAIAVAGPVLAQSTRLEDADLVDIAKSKGQAHLLAIAGRRALGQAVTDVLVRRGNPYVKRNVAANPAASFSAAGYGELLASARADGTLAERMVRRADIPPAQFCALLTQATEEVRARLIAAAPPERHAEIRRVLERVSGEIAEGAAQPRDYGGAIRALLLEYPSGSLGEKEVAQFAAAKAFERTVAALSLLAAVPADLVESLMTGERLEPVLILCKAVRSKWPTARAVLQLRPGPRVSAPALTEACDDFTRLSPSSAQQMLHYWQRQATGF